MELEEIKKTWKTIIPTEHYLSGHNQITLKKRADVKSKLIRRMIVAASMTFVGFSLMATSHFWAPLKLNIPLLTAICIILLLGFLAEMYLTRLIVSVNIYEDSHTSVLKAIIKIKKTYKRVEIWFSALIAIPILWMTITPPVINTTRILIILAIMATALTLEFLWYRKTIKYLNELIAHDTI